MWVDGYKASNLMLFVLDTAEKQRFPEAKQVLEKVLVDEETKGVPLVFLFHKMDTEAAKNNYNEAFEFFKASMTIGERDGYKLKTSVKQPKSIESIKTTIAKIVAKSRA